MPLRPQIGPTGKPLVDVDHKPIVCDAPNCGCPTPIPTDCTPDEFEVDCALVETLECMCNIPWAITWNFANHDGVNWSILSITTLMIPNGDCTGFTSNVPPSTWKRLFNNLDGFADLLFYVGADCLASGGGSCTPDSHVVYLNFQCVEGDLIATCGYSARNVDCFGAAVPSYWKAQINLGATHSMPGTIVAPGVHVSIDRGDWVAECTFVPNTFEYKLPYLVNATISPIGSCPAPTDCETTGPTAGFTATKRYGCVFAVVDTSTSGDCDHECYWSDGKVGCDRTNIFVFLGDECGEQTASLTQTVVDTRGCWDEYTEDLECCNCDDGNGPCFNGGSAELSIEPDAEDLCKYHLCASIPPEVTQLCATTGEPFIEYQLLSASMGCDYSADECDCVTIGTEDCVPGASCTNALLDGDCDVITLTRSAGIRWRVWDGPCGCPGEWNYDVLACSVCGCCDGFISGVFVTLDGYTEGDNGPTYNCDCDPVNGTWELDQEVAACVYNFNSNIDYPSGIFPCVDTTIPFTYHLGLEISARFTCEDRGDGTLWIYVNGYVNTGGTNVAIEIVHPVPGGIPADCSFLESIALPFVLPLDDYTCTPGTMTLHVYFV